LADKSNTENKVEDVKIEVNKKIKKNTKSAKEKREDNKTV